MSLEFSLKKKFKDFEIDVSLSLGEEFVVLFGPSGAGKSLLLNMLSGIVLPDAGAVTANGETLFDSERGVNAPIRSRRIGQLFQDYALFPHMSVYENVAYGISASPPDEARSRVGELLSLMRLADFKDRRPHELSGGQKQRCALARTLAVGPRVLLLDEPFSALDYQVREKLRTDLVNIHDRFRITTVLVTHDLEEAFMLGDRIAVLNNGSLEQYGSREDVFYRPATRSVARFIGARNIFSGRVMRMEGGEALIRCDGIGDVRAPVPPGAAFTEGQDVSFCIRPEEIIVIRPDRAIDGRVQDNILEGEIISATNKGSVHILFLRIGRGEAQLKVELPNFVVRKLRLATGKSIRVSLKKENVWVIP